MKRYEAEITKLSAARRIQFNQRLERTGGQPGYFVRAAVAAGR